MQRREKLWDVGTAKTWLRSYPWGDQFQLAESTRPAYAERWVRMIMRMNAAMNSHAMGVADGAKQ